MGLFAAMALLGLAIALADRIPTDEEKVAKKAN